MIKQLNELWHLAQDLGPGPNHYISVYYGAREVARFNADRKEWPASDHKALSKLIRFLNQLE